MPRNLYSPRLSDDIVRALYHEARHQRKPMTRLVDEILSGALYGTAGWQIAQQSSVVQEQHDTIQRDNSR